MMISTAFAHPYTYEKKHIHSQVIHIVKLNPNSYTAELVKANNGDPGRETVPKMAKRSQADIAINGGFFHIGGIEDGMPSGTLVIQGKQYNLRKNVQALLVIKSGIISIELATPKKYLHDNISVVAGIPMLIERGQISRSIFNKKSGFYTKPHARTAIGIDRQGTVILVVAQAEGLTLLALAQLMKTLGCTQAVNLDGGGSSTLWIKDKVVNTVLGDSDENLGEFVLRPVSDALVFKIKPSPGPRHERLLG